MPPWSVYIVRCRDKSLYTGISKDVAARIVAHNSGRGAAYTRSHRPVKLVWTRVMKSESAARKREVRIKQLTKKEKERLVKEKVGKTG
jgi:putative endonuclease